MTKMLKLIQRVQRGTKAYTEYMLKLCQVIQLQKIKLHIFQ